MYKIVSKKELNPTVVQMEIEAPLVAAKAKPGQFIILRVDADGERIPLTVAGVNPASCAVKIIFQVVGATTTLLRRKNAGEYLQDFVGPLGVPTHTSDLPRGLPISRLASATNRLPERRASFVKNAQISQKTADLRDRRRAQERPKPGSTRGDARRSPV